MNTPKTDDGTLLKSTDLLEFAVDLEIYDLLSNSRIKKYEVIEAKDEDHAKRIARWTYGTTTEVNRVYLF